MQLRPVAVGERAPLTTAPYSLGEAAGKPAAVSTFASTRALKSVSGLANPAMAASTKPGAKADIRDAGRRPPAQKPRFKSATSW